MTFGITLLTGDPGITMSAAAAAGEVLDYIARRGEH